MSQTIVAEILQELRSDALSLDPVEWAEETLEYPNRRTKRPEPVSLQTHQANALRKAAAMRSGLFLHSVIALCWAKGWAKTFSSAIYGLWRADNFPRQRIVCLANSRKQSTSTLFYYMQQLVLTSTKLLQRLGAENVGETFIKFPNGSVIEVVPCKLGTTAGIRIDLLMNTETHEIPDRRVLDQLMSQADGPNCQTIIDSHASDDENVLAHFKELAENGDKTIFFNYVSGIADVKFPWWRDGFLAERQRALLPLEFERWHLNRFGSGDKKLFPKEVLDKMFDPRVPMRCTREWLAQFAKEELDGIGCAVGGGLDRSAPWTHNERDETVWSSTAKIACKDGPHYVLLSQAIPPLNSEARLKDIVLQGHGEWRYRNTKFESYQAGDIYLWAVSQHVTAELCHAQGADQARAFAELYTAAKEGRVHISPERRDLREQLKNFEAELQGNKPVFGLLKKAGRRDAQRRRILDDKVYSFAWSVDAVIDVVTYTPSFRSTGAGGGRRGFGLEEELYGDD